MKRLAATMVCLFLTLPAWAVTYSFGVVPHRSAVIAAQYWNPILDYVGRKTGVTLVLKTGKSLPVYSAAEARSEFDFVYDLLIFAPSHAAVGYRVIARSAGPSLHGRIVVPQGSPVRALRELDGREVGFAGKDGFPGYAVPMSALIQAGVTVTPVFGGNQEGIMAQLRAGRISAAGVNSRVMQEYAAREGFKYRALWTSEPYLDLPVAAHPRVPQAVVKAVREALIGMAADPQGLKILAASAAIVKQAPPFGFVAARETDYDKQRAVYRLIWKKEGR